MESTFVVYLLLAAAAICNVNCNLEGDILNAWRSKLIDPNKVLQSWDPTLVDPCTYFHVTCNSNNRIIRLDLGSAGLSGPIIPELGQLSSLQYLELYDNGFIGSIPKEIGNLTALVSLDLYQNKLVGTIPSSLGRLTSLRFMRLNNNTLSGRVPTKVIQLILLGELQNLDISVNMFAGRRKSINSTEFAITKVVQDPKGAK